MVGLARLYLMCFGFGCILVVAAVGCKGGGLLGLWLFVVVVGFFFFFFNKSCGGQ